MDYMISRLVRLTFDFYLKEDPIVKITSDEFDGSLIDFRANRSQFSTGRPVFLRE